MSVPPTIAVVPSPTDTSMSTPAIVPNIAPSVVSKFPTLPVPTVLPSLVPVSTFAVPMRSAVGTLMVAGSESPSLLRIFASYPVPSQVILPPPGFASSP